MAKLDWYIRANLKPRHMQLVVALDDLRHVGRVATLLNVSQPAISKALGEIERGLGVSLFERTPRGLMPTAYGESLIRMSRTMLQSLDAAGEELRHLQTGVTGRVRLGVLPVAAPVLAPRAIVRLQEKAPRSVVICHEATADRLLPMLRDGQLDLVVGTLPPASLSAGLEIHTFGGVESMVAVCGRQHPLAKRKSLRADDLKAYPFVIPPLGTFYRSAVEKALESLGIPMSQATLESGSMVVSNSYLRESAAIGLYSSHLGHHYARQGWLHRLPISLPQLGAPIGWVRQQNAVVTPALRDLVEQLAQVAKDALEVQPDARSG